MLDENEEIGGTTRRTNFEAIYPDNTPLRLLVEDNPKKKGSQAALMFEGYRGAKTVGHARRKGVSYQAIAHDLGRRYIELG
jgi:hypothetical protein